MYFPYFQYLTKSANGGEKKPVEMRFCCLENKHELFKWMLGMTNITTGKSFCRPFEVKEEPFYVGMEKVSHNYYSEIELTEFMARHFSFYSRKFAA